MGKKSKCKNTTSIQTLLSDDNLRALGKKEIQSVRERLDKINKEYRIDCQHTDKKGEMKVDVINPESRLVECEKCSVRFSLNIVSAKELNHATRIFSDVINQIKLLSAGGAEDKKTIRDLGLILENINNVNKLYTKTLIESDKKNKNKKQKKHNSDGYYGSSTIKFDNGRRK